MSIGAEIVDPVALAHWMDLQRLGSGPLSAVALLGGGTQNMLLRFERSGRSYVLRRPPPHPRPESNETMRREICVLNALAQTTIPHPRLIAASPEEDVLGVAFYLMEQVNGFNPVSGLPTAYCDSEIWRKRMALAMVESAAALGSLDYISVGLGDFGRPEGFLERQTGRWLAQYEGYSTFENWGGEGGLSGIDHLASWLERHRPLTIRAGLMHGDFHMANAMFCFDRPELAAIVDWELATIGDPLIDLGWLLATWPEMPDGTDTPVPISPWSAFPNAYALVAHYQMHSDRDLSSVDWYKVLGCFKLAILLEGTHARASAGQASKSTGDRLHANAASLIQRALRWAE